MLECKYGFQPHQKHVRLLVFFWEKNSGACITLQHDKNLDIDPLDLGYYIMLKLSLAFTRIFFLIPTSESYFTVVISNPGCQLPWRALCDWSPFCLHKAWIWSLKDKTFVPSWTSSALDEQCRKTVFSRSIVFILESLFVASLLLPTASCDENYVHWSTPVYCIRLLAVFVFQKKITYLKKHYDILHFCFIGYKDVLLPSYGSWLWTLQIEKICF